jgi:hypothetical protein
MPEERHVKKLYTWKLIASKPVGSPKIEMVRSCRGNA